MTVDALLTELRRRWEECRERFKTTDEEIAAWAGHLGLDTGEALDLLGVALARGYLSDQLRWEFCDNVVNNLVWLAWGVPEGAWERPPHIFLEVFYTIEIGESRPFGDPETVQLMKQQLAETIQKATSR
jgi:hypothetical protein